MKASRSAAFLTIILLAACGSGPAPVAAPASASQPAPPSTSAAPSASAAVSAKPTAAVSPSAAASAAPSAANASAKPAASPTPVPPASTAPFAYGVAAGGMTADSAVLWTRTPGPASVQAELAANAAFSNPITPAAVQATKDHDFTVKVVADHLQPGTTYYYRFRAGSDVSPTGTFKTAYAPNQDAKVTMAFSGDADWKWKPYPLLKSLIKEKLDYFFFLGDLLYETTNLQGTTSVEDLDGYRFKYRENREPRANSASKMTPMLDLYRDFGMYSVFDNHETGYSAADKTAPPYNEGGAQAGGTFVNQTPGWRARVQAYSEYQPVQDDVVSGTGDSRSDKTPRFYQAIPWGANAELMILDDRSYRDARLAKSDDPAAKSCQRTMLGAPQLQWFEQELQGAKSRNVTWKIVVVSSPIQQLGTASQVGGDLDSGKSWAGGYVCERNKILKFIDDNSIDNVVFLTTDNHYTVINNLKYNSVPDDPSSPLKSARNAFEILTGPMGAGAGNPSGLKVDTKGLSIREADRRILDVWNGDTPDTSGQMHGLKQAGLDPIGLEASFPGLVKESIHATGVQPGVVQPLDFASFNTYSYAVLTLDKSAMTVQVKGLPYVADPAPLASDAAAEQEYESRDAQEILSFQVKPQ